MKLGYDVFRRLDDGSVLWVAEAATLDQARQILRTLSSAKPSDCFVRDATTGKILGDLDPNPEKFGEACA